jgi:hypothetical protein
VLLAAVVGVVLLLAATLASTGAYLRARVEAVAAADAAALAAAPVTFAPFGAPGTAWDEAARFAQANGARLVWCKCAPDLSWEPRTITVRVSVESRLWPVGSVTVEAVGRAEFSPAVLLVDD